MLLICINIYMFAGTRSVTEVGLLLIYCWRHVESVGDNTFSTTTTTMKGKVKQGQRETKSSKLIVAEEFRGRIFL